MKQLLNVTLGILTATGGFIDAGAIATSGAAGANFGLGWCGRCCSRQAR